MVSINVESIAFYKSDPRYGNTDKLFTLVTDKKPCEGETFVWDDVFYIIKSVVWEPQKGKISVYGEVR